MEKIRISEEMKEKMMDATVGLATINFDDGKPRNIAMEINKFEGDTIIMTDNHLHKCVENIKKNPFVSIVFWNDEMGIRIDGKAEYEEKGKWFDYVKNLESNKKYSPKGAIVIKVQEVKVLG